MESLTTDGMHEPVLLLCRYGRIYRLLLPTTFVTYHMALVQSGQCNHVFLQVCYPYFVSIKYAVYNTLRKISHNDSPCMHL